MYIRTNSYLVLLLLLERAVGPRERLEEERVGRPLEVLGEEPRHAPQHPRQPRLPTRQPRAPTEKKMKDRGGRFSEIEGMLCSFTTKCFGQSINDVRGEE